MLMIGVVGGKTESRLAACDEKGNVLAQVTCGGIDYNELGMFAVRSELARGIDLVLDAAGEDWYDYLAIGTSAICREAGESEFLQFCGDEFESSRTYLNSDVHMTLLGATGGDAGIAVINGNDVIGAGIDEAGREYSAGGWGRLLNCEGSAFDIGNRVIRAAIRASEGGEATVLTGLVSEWFGVEKLREIIPVIYAEDFDDSKIAEAARIASLGAENGDEVSERILSDAALSCAYVAKDIVNQMGVLPVYTSGEIFERFPLYERKFSDHMKILCPEVRVARPKLAPEIGALISAAGLTGVDSLEFMANLEKSAKK